MSSVFLPAHVVLVFRRLVNVVSTLSISNQYLLPKRYSDEQPLVVEPSKEKASFQEASNLQQITWKSLQVLHAFEWNTWHWLRFSEVGEKTGAARFLGLQNAISEVSAISLAWLNYKWLQSWFSLLSMAPDTQGIDSGDIGSLPPYNRSKDRIPLSPPLEPMSPKKGSDRKPLDTIHRLMQNPLLYDPLRTPRYPIVLSHGLYGFDVRGPSSFPPLRMHYWSNVLSVLRDKVGAEVIVTAVPGTGSIASRSEAMDRQLQIKARGRGVNFLAHSMGGLDCRHLISHGKPTEYVPLSLTTVSTPHRGSPFMDWCAQNIGIGKLREREALLSKPFQSEVQDPFAADVLPPSASGQPTSKSDERAKSDGTAFSLSFSSLPSSFATLLLSIVDSPAYANLTSAYLNNIFNPATPNDPRVKYFSVAGRMPSVSVWHPFWLPKMVLDSVEEKERGALRAVWEGEGGRDIQDGERPLWSREEEWGNDGLVTVQSAKWGEFLGIMDGADHWEMRGARGIQLGVDLPLVGGGESGDGWGFKDWGRFVGAWKKEEKIQRDAAAAAVKKGDSDIARGEQRDRELEKERDDAFVKSSTDKLSAVFDWLVEQVPARPMLGVKAKVLADAEQKTSAMAEMRGEQSDMKKHMEKVGNTKERRKNELATKLDLERFYVALSRKLYDEGL